MARVAVAVHQPSVLRLLEDSVELVWDGRAAAKFEDVPFSLVLLE